MRARCARPTACSSTAACSSFLSPGLRFRTLLPLCAAWMRTTAVTSSTPSSCASPARLSCPTLPPPLWHRRATRRLLNPNATRTCPHKGSCGRQPVKASGTGTYLCRSGKCMCSMCSAIQAVLAVLMVYAWPLLPPSTMSRSTGGSLPCTSFLRRRRPGRLSFVSTALACACHFEGAVRRGPA